MNNFKPSDYTILMVDDSPRNLQVLGGTLRELEYEVEYATNGRKALEWIEKIKFDLILLDIMMPVMDGFEVCRKIRSNKKYDDIPILFITAKTETESIVKGFKAGGQDYVTKPFDANELLARVKTHIELRISKQKLKNTNKWLEEKVAERTSELEQANIELKELDKAKSQFLRVINYEIRTPLNGILCGVELMKEFSLSEDMQSFLETLKLSATKLEEFAFRALEVSNFNVQGSDALKLEETNIEQVYSMAIAACMKKAKEKNIEIDLHYKFGNGIITIDEKYYGNCLKYLIDNAVKFGNKNSKVIITVSSEQKNLVTQITDVGIPFPKGFDINIFNPFLLGNNINQSPGISLFLCKQIIYAHGGEVENYNTENGARVVFKIPT